MAQVLHGDRSGPIGSIACPTDENLLAFAEGALTEPASETIIEHLTRCQKCEMSLARLAEKSSLAGRFRANSAADALIQEAECLRMQNAIRDLPNRAPGGRAEPDEESTDKTRLSTDHLPPGRAPPAGEATTAYVPPAQTIGRYQVRSVLGEGAYGQVYLAQDPQLDRQVAIKVAKFGPTVSRRLIDAFLAEAKILAKLKHPGIVAVHDAGFDPAAGCYIVMELVEGRSLKQVMKAGKVPNEQAAKYIAQAAEAVHYAHKQGVVHRDLKPANLLLDADGNIKVADFGLAILEEEQRERAGEIAGTLLYSSPEQVRGEAHHLDGRADIWSLGVILYELLTGRRPFSGPSLTDEILHRPPKPPRQIDDAVLPELERICLKCLAKEGFNRYCAAKDLRNELRAMEAPVPRAVFGMSAWKVAISITLVVLLVAIALPVAAWLNTLPDQGSREGSAPSVQASSRDRPYDLDQLAEPGTWQALLMQEPRYLFSNDPQRELCLFTEKNQSFLMNTPSGYLVGLGSTNQLNFELQVDVTKYAREGSFGFFLGYKPSREHPGSSIAQFVLLSYTDPMDCIVQREIARVLEERDGTMGTRNRSMFASTPVRPLIADGVRLEIAVKGGEIDRIVWRGEEFRDLRGKRTPAFMHYTNCVGEFGLINLSGTTTFQGPRFRIHSRSTP